MSIRIRWTLPLIALAGALLLVLNLGSPSPALAQFSAVSITTDRTQYQPGDSIRVCYTVAAPGPFTITDTQADGTTRTFFSGYDDGTGGCLTGTVTPPTGTECLRITASGGIGGSAQACFQVGSNVPPPPPPCIQIYPPPPGCGGGSASISTDQSQYNVGSPIRICYTVPGPGPVTITDLQADGSNHVLLSVYDDGTGWCFGATVTPPAGTECLRMDYSSTAGSGSTQTCFQVNGSGSFGCNAPVRTLTVADNNSSITLRSGQCFLLNLDSGDNWTVSIDNPSVLSCDSQFSSTQQGSCTALTPGYTTLRATGTPTCYPQCLRPSLLFQLSVNVLP